ncbi:MULTISPECIES: hypothetical protein [Bacteroidaceae]|uniref:hypothetical protein n=1 Tax=Bacteroidaceae TaxID=815 RepID=UPI00192C3EC5|nr:MULTISPECIES: hypothetical protein [Bacteroidaceae]MCR1855675.1 hypothetical protein [Phocaeicola vulgatus]QQY41650.1 hypothetical protein I6I56_17735 [Phocaeicola vulgatus]
MTRSKFFYIILGIHVLCGILGLIILSFIDVYDRIRWSIGDMLRLLFFLTPFVLIFCVPKKMPTWSKVCMRIYCGVYILPFVIFPPLWWMMFNFDHVIAENEQYIIRFYKGGLRDYYEQKSIYKKSEILEKYIGCFDCYGSGIYYELNQLEYDIEKFKIDEMTFTRKVILKRNKDEQIITKDTLIVCPIVKDAPF